MRNEWAPRKTFGPWCQLEKIFGFGLRGQRHQWWFYFYTKFNIFKGLKKWPSSQSEVLDQKNLILKDHKQNGNNQSLERIGWIAKVINISVNSHPEERLALCVKKGDPWRPKSGARGGKLAPLMFPVVACNMKWRESSRKKLEILWLYRVGAERRGKHWGWGHPWSSMFKK